MKLGQIKPANKNIDHTNRIVLAYPIFQAFRKQRDLLAIHSLNGLGQSYSHLADPIACSTAATAASVQSPSPSPSSAASAFSHLVVVRGLHGKRIGFGDCGRGLRGGGV